MLTNTLPFRGKGTGDAQKRDLYLSIIEKEPNYKILGLCLYSIDLLRKLFIKDPKERIGSEGGA